MDQNQKWLYEKRIAQVIEVLAKRNIDAECLESAEAAVERAAELIAVNATVGLSGSKTLEQLGLVNRLEKEGRTVINQYKAGLSPEESLRLRNEGASADYFLTSVNAITLQGELLIQSCLGHRVAGVAMANKVIIIAGAQKIVKDISEGLDRTRNYVAPMNCKRLNRKTLCLETGWCDKEACNNSEYERICCQTLIIESEAQKGRIQLLLIPEELGM